LGTVVATTHQNGTCSLLTSAKLSVGYLVVGITRELDKEPSLHCYPIYISYRLSQIRYSLVVILELNGVSEVQYKEVMIIDDE